MATSQNGWAVDASGALQDRGTVHGVSFPNGVRRGDVATVLFYVAGRFHDEVEDLVAGWCWGWHVKQIEGGTSISNHASGTAIDLNAPRHPVGVRNTFTPAQRTAIRRILDDCDGVVRWGGDYVNRADDMHFEIVKGQAAVTALANRIEREQQMTTPAQNWAHDIDSSAGTYSAGGALWTVLGRTGALTGATGLPAVLGQVKASLDALVDDVDVDLDALGASLVYLKAGLDLLLADPFDVGEAHPLVQVHRYIQAHPTPPA